MPFEAGRQVRASDVGMCHSPSGVSQHELEAVLVSQRLLGNAEQLLLERQLPAARHGRRTGGCRARNGAGCHGPASSATMPGACARVTGEAAELKLLMQRALLRYGAGLRRYIDRLGGITINELTL